MAAKAPAGHHTRIQIGFTLAPHKQLPRRYQPYAWTSALSVDAALRLAPGWGKRQMSEDLVVGRSKIEAVELTVKLHKGEAS